MERSRLDLSSNTSFQLLHSLRGIHDAVLVGINTVAFDQPRLNVRNPLKASCFPKIQPRPVVIDTNLRIKHLQSMQLANPIVITCVSNETELFQECLAKLNSIGGDLVCCKVDSAGR